jgi:CubicO group peptidase (beta-lactamase class C family)
VQLTPVITAALLTLAGTTFAEPFSWRVDAPEAHGLATAKLESLRDHLAAHGTKAFLLVRDDRIVCEWYAADHSATKTHYSASMAKALVGGISVAVALSDGRLTLDDPVVKFIPQWRDDLQKSQITFRQLGSHTSGLEDAEDGKETPHTKLTGWKGEFWQRLPPPRDPFTLARDAAPVIFTPGSRLAYSNPGIAMLGYATTAALREAPEKDLRTLLRDRVMRPIGIADGEWSAGYGQPVSLDGLALVAAWGGGAFTARASARLGRLMLREGDWDGRRLISAEAVRAVTRDVGTPGNCGIGWWSNQDGTVASLPRDAFWGAGAGHQLTLVIPSLKLIAVRNGSALNGPSTHLDYDRARDTLFFQPLMRAVSAGSATP